MNLWLSLSKYSFLLFVLSPLFVSCNSDDELLPVETLEGQMQRIASYLNEHEIKAEQHESGYYFIKSLENTNGTNIARYNVVALQYRISVLDGSILEDSFGQEAQYMQVGVGAILPKGLDLALPQFREGEEGTLFLPAEWAFQSFNNSNIPVFSNFQIDFRVTEVLDYEEIKQQELLMFENYIADNQWNNLVLNPVDSVEKLVDHVFYKKTRVGTTKPEQDTRLLVNYRLSSFPTGVIREESVEMLYAAKNQLFSAFRIALETMDLDERAFFLISSDFGYGASVFVMPTQLKSAMEEDFRIPHYAVEIKPFTPLHLEVEILNL